MSEKQKAYADLLKSIGLRPRTFEPAEDILFLRWWMSVTESGDIEKITSPSARRLPKFLNLFEAHHAVLYSLNEQSEIQFVFWLSDYQPDSKTAFVNVWSHDSIRASSKLLRMTFMAHKVAFELNENLFALTWQDKVLRMCQRLGYTLVGTMPHYLGQDLVYIMHYSKEAFKNSDLLGE